MAYHSCSNCNYPFGKSYKFCPNCGLNQTEELTLKALFNNTIQNYFAFDARFFKSFIPLLIKPGFLPKQFINGKRLTYLHPAQLYLFSTILFFFIFSFQVNNSALELDSNMSSIFKKEEKKLTKNELISRREADSLNELNIRQNLRKTKLFTNFTDKQIDSIASESKTNNIPAINYDFNEARVDSLIAINATNALIYKEMGLSDDSGYLERQFYKQLLKFYKSPNTGSLYKNFIQNVPIALFFLLPIFALLLRLYYFKMKPYAKHLVFSFYYFAFIFFVFSITKIINYIYDLPDIIDFLILLSCFIYLVVAIRNFYIKKWIGTFIKTGVLVATYFIFVIPLGAAITLVVSFLFY